MQVANLVDMYKESIANMWVYDDGSVKGIIQIENGEIKKLFVELNFLFVTLLSTIHFSLR